MRCYSRYLIMRQMKRSIGNYSQQSDLTVVKMNWSCPAQNRPCEDNHAMDSQRKWQKWRQRKLLEDNIRRWTGISFAVSQDSVEESGGCVFNDVPSAFNVAYCKSFDAPRLLRHPEETPESMRSKHDEDILTTK
ncbi:Uncharacterised protein r2_g3097 [Pycnogonum litorale]